MGFPNQNSQWRGLPGPSYCLFLFGMLAVALSGCQILENLTEPVTGALQRTISLSMTPSSLPEGGGTVEVEATVLVTDAPEAAILVTFSATSGNFLDGDTATTDTDGKARVRLHTTTTTEITAAIKAAGVIVTESSPSRVEVGDEVLSTGKVKIEVEFSPRPAELNKSVQIKVTATKDDGSAATGTLKVEFGDGKSTRIPDFKQRATVEHTYREASFFNVVASVITGSGEVSSRTSSLRVNDTTETSIVLSVATLETYAREPLSFHVALDNTRPGKASGRVTLDWGDGRSTNLGDVTGATSVEHIFRDPGSYRVVAKVTTPNGKGAQASVRVRIEARLTADLDLAADVGFLGEATSFAVVATLSNGAAPNGTATIDYGDGAVVTEPVRHGTAKAVHTYVSEGTYMARVNFEDDAGRTASAALTVVIKAEEPSEGGGGSSNSQDELDLSQVVFLNYDISNWSITSTLSSVSISAGQICMPHTKAGQWPTTRAPSSGVTIEASTWIIANVNGTWYAAIFEWQPVGGICKTLGSKPPTTTVASQMKSHVKFAPLTSWTPQSGEAVYIMVSALAWPGFVPVLAQERSQVVRAVWP